MPNKKVRPVKDRAKRDSKGRFLKGTPGGPGNPMFFRLAEYRKTINDAVTPAKLRKVLAVLIRKAEQGDLMAIKELLDRTVGRATHANQAAAQLDLELPELATTADTVKASNAILQGLNQGRITAEDATRLSQVVEIARRTLETHDLAEQLETLRSRIEQEQFR
ncbi:MAG: hypothetical protein AAF916_04680 [Planctomycetota bacterium]